MKIFVAASVCAFINTAPAWSQNSVEPGARQIFAKAASRYGNAQTLQLRWKDNALYENTYEQSATRGVVAFNQKGNLRWQSTARTSPYSLMVADGKNAYFLLSEASNAFPHPIYRRNPISSGRQAALNLLSERGDWYHVLSLWFAGKSPLTRRNLSAFTQKYKIAKLTAKTLPTAKYFNQPCDLVRVNATYSDKKTLQETYWFQKSSGQLVRLQRKKSGSKNQSDIRIEPQQFNPKLPVTTFRFTPPKGAKLVQKS